MIDDNHRDRGVTTDAPTRRKDATLSTTSDSMRRTVLVTGAAGLIGVPM
ncbi:hypothetical protein SAXI111661_12775 [Saccharomonospora xinjiangensis]|nr:hypothetical protein [Saccharomonospora xinjiangensis]QBQ61486.1 hypothetical protein EYD13_15690 [Saccharomonospora xinjiangensis]